MVNSIYTFRAYDSVVSVVAFVAKPSWSITVRLACLGRAQAMPSVIDHGHGWLAPVVVPPEGWHVEWQVKLDSADGTTVTWGTYSPAYQEAIEAAWQLRAAGVDYQPGRTQTYRLDFGAMVQTRTSCSEGWGTRRSIRRIFVPNESASEPRGHSEEDMPELVDAAGPATS